MKDNEDRIAIIKLHNMGMKNSEIVKITEYGKMKVKRTVDRYIELGTSSDRPRSGRPSTAVTSCNVNKVRCNIRRNPERSMRQMAIHIGISEERVRHIVHNKLKMRSYKMFRGQLLNDAMRANRLIKARQMTKQIAAGRLQKVLFTDEKIFTVQRAHNRQNDRQLLKLGAQRYAAAKIIARSHFPSSVMVWGGICASGKTPLVFIDRNVKINAASYQKDVLTDVLYPWKMEHFGGKEFILQQDWAPAHSARTTISVCEQLFPGFWGKDVWPSNSPDLNPMDYSVWSILENKLSRIRIKSKEHLKTVLKQAWDEISVEDCATIVGNFPRRLKQCIASKG